MDGIRVAKKVMQALLKFPDRPLPEISLNNKDYCEIDGGANHAAARASDKTINFPVAVAAHIGKNRAPGRLFIQAVDRHNRKKLSIAQESGRDWKTEKLQK